MLIAVLTVAGIVFSKEPKQLKGGAPAVILLLIVAWMCVTTTFALSPDDAQRILERVLKIQFFTFIALFVLSKREHVIWLIATIAASIGYYAVKGGLFTLLHGGSYIVWGPADSFISDNNSLALATVMSIPLWGYLYILATKRWVRIALAAAMALSAVSALGSFSRGALLAMSAMLALLWLRGRRKAVLGVALAIVASAIIAFMPNKWEERMASIQTYEEDASAQGRINTWIMLFNLANDRPLVGGGFEPYTKEIFQRYRPEYSHTHSAHSIYFQALGEQGYVGLLLLLTFWILTWRLGSSIRRMTRDRPDEAWAFWLASMVQVSLAAYFVGGTFLNLAWWDMPYYLMVSLVVTRHAIQNQRRAGVESVQQRPVDRSASVSLRRAN
jgi:probable O-glycosylation ligase (exosortase A-associated)